MTACASVKRMWVGDDAAGSVLESGQGSSLYLLPGDYVVANKPYTVRTLLGSCVAVCLWDREANTGGICHYLLPKWSGDNVPGPQYGDIAIQGMIEKIMLLGSRQRNLKARVFGGACVLQAFQAHPDHVGTQNVMTALKTLGALSIPVIEQRVGGDRGMSVTFSLATGEAAIRML